MSTIYDVKVILFAWFKIINNTVYQYNGFNKHVLIPNVRSINYAIQNAIKKVENKQKVKGKDLEEPAYAAALAIEFPNLMNAGIRFPNILFGGCFNHKNQRWSFEVAKDVNLGMCWFYCENRQWMILAITLVDSIEKRKKESCKAVKKRYTIVHK